LGKNTLPITGLRLYNITSKAALECGGEVWVLNKKCQKSEATEMKFLRSLLGLTSLYHQRNTTVREKLKLEHIVDGIQTYQIIGYSMLKGQNTHEHPVWHWHTNQKANATKADHNKVERQTASSRLSFHRADLESYIR
jgi:hypothetical protein